MEHVPLVILVVVASIALVTVSALLFFIRPNRRGRHDDMQRVGDESAVTPMEAFRRADGDAAWTRISGGA
jgi:NADH:ubiquinone oxidoreductase subunit 3 (subunit A)